MLAVVAAVCALLDHVSHGVSAWVFVAVALAVMLWALRTPTEPLPAALAELGPAPNTRTLFHEGVVLGLTGFGGGFAVLAQIERRLSERRRWIAADTFLESAAL